MFFYKCLIPNADMVSSWSGQSFSHYLFPAIISWNGHLSIHPFYYGLIYLLSSSTQIGKLSEIAWSSSTQPCVCKKKRGEKWKTKVAMRFFTFLCRSGLPQCFTWVLSFLFYSLFKKKKKSYYNVEHLTTSFRQPRKYQKYALVLIVVILFTFPFSLCVWWQNWLPSSEQNNHAEWLSLTQNLSIIP